MKTHCKQGHEFTSENTYHCREKGRLRRRCRTCSLSHTTDWQRRNKERNRPKQRAYYAANTEKSKNWAFKRKYKIGIEFLVGKPCEICGKQDWTKERLGGPNVDHDHTCCPLDVTCGKCVRGVLCNRCNVGLGKLGEKNLVSALVYLLKYGSLNTAHMQPFYDVLEATQ